MEGSVSDIALPECENLSDQIVLEEFHARENIEHRTLAHPFMKLEEFSRSWLSFSHHLESSISTLHYLNDSFITHSEVFIVEELVIMHNFQIVRSELASAHYSPVAVQKLYRHARSMLGKESNGLCSIGYGLLKIPYWGSFLNEVCLTKFILLIVLQVFNMCNDLNKLIEVKFIFCFLVFDFLIVVIHVHLDGFFFVILPPRFW